MGMLIIHSTIFIPATNLWILIAQYKIPNINMYNDFKELLIIDDDCCHNIVCALAIKKLFRSSDVNFTCFTSSEDGLAYIMKTTASNKKTLLFLDINMPRLNGWQMLDQLEQLPRSVKRHLD